MRALVAHSLGSQTEDGVRSTARKSTRSRNSSGRTRRSGRTNRKRATTPAAVKRPTRARRSRVRRAGKDVHQHQGEGRAHHGRKNQEGHHDGHHQEIEDGAGSIGEPVGQEEGHGQESHHPGGIEHGLQKARPIELKPIGGGSHQELHVPGEEERGEGGDDVGKEEDPQEGQEGQAQELSRQEVPDPLGVPEVEEHPPDDPEDQGPEEEAHAPEDQGLE